MRTTLFRCAVFAAAATFGLTWSGTFHTTELSGFLSQANAIRGRPATPMSYAGVARRTTVGVGAVGVGAAVAVGTAAAVAATSGCVTTYNAYGQAVQTCN